MKSNNKDIEMDWTKKQIKDFKETRRFWKFAKKTGVGKDVYVLKKKNTRLNKLLNFCAFCEYFRDLTEIDCEKCPLYPKICSSGDYSTVYIDWCRSPLNSYESKRNAKIILAAIDNYMKKEGMLFSLRKKI